MIRIKYIYIFRNDDDENLWTNDTISFILSTKLDELSVLQYILIK